MEVDGEELDDEGEALDEIEANAQCNGVTGAGERRHGGDPDQHKLGYDQNGPALSDDVLFLTARRARASHLR